MSQPCRWRPDDLSGLDASTLPSIPLISEADISDILPGFQLWDCWPIETLDGQPATIMGGTAWVIMCAPRRLHPDLRHDVARLRLMLDREGQWLDCGYLLPDDLNPGSREWAGSTILHADGLGVTLYYTVTGRRGEATRSFEQRLFETTGRLDLSGALPKVAEWTKPVENVVADDRHYQRVTGAESVAGFIKGFRDPFHFRDPINGQRYLVFTASQANSRHPFDGVIGLARSANDKATSWDVRPALVSAEGLNNEMERPVLRWHQGHYYLFWSTQRRTFAPDGPAGPNGLYGMVASRLDGPWEPLNGTGLVAANPASEPFQTYSWWVTNSFGVTGFVDLWGLKGKRPVDDPDLVARHFGGTLAPRFSLNVSGNNARVKYSSGP